MAVFRVPDRPGGARACACVCGRRWNPSLLSGTKHPSPSGVGVGPAQAETSSRGRKGLAALIWGALTRRLVNGRRRPRRRHHRRRHRASPQGEDEEERHVVSQSVSPVPLRRAQGPPRLRRESPPMGGCGCCTISESDRQDPPGRTPGPANHQGCLTPSAPKVSAPAHRARQNSKKTLHHQASPSSSSAAAAGQARQTMRPYSTAMAAALGPARRQDRADLIVQAVDVLALPWCRGSHYLRIAVAMASVRRPSLAVRKW